MQVSHLCQLLTQSVRTVHTDKDLLSVNFVHILSLNGMTRILIMIIWLLKISQHSLATYEHLEH